MKITSTWYYFISIVREIGIVLYKIYIIHIIHLHTWCPFMCKFSETQQRSSRGIGQWFTTTREWFCPPTPYPGALDSVWRHFWLSEYYWNQVCRSRDAANTPAMQKTAPPITIIWSKKINCVKIYKHCYRVHLYKTHIWLDYSAGVKRRTSFHLNNQSTLKTMKYSENKLWSNAVLYQEQIFKSFLMRKDKRLFCFLSLVTSTPVLLKVWNPP